MQGLTKSPLLSVPCKAGGVAVFFGVPAADAAAAAAAGEVAAGREDAGGADLTGVEVFTGTAEVLAGVAASEASSFLSWPPRQRQCHRLSLPARPWPSLAI